MVIRRIIDMLKAMSSWRLLLLVVLFAEAASTVITSLMSLLFHGRIVRDYLITSGVVSLLVSFAVAFMLIGLIRETQSANEETEKNQSLLQTQLRFSQHLIDTIPMPVFYKNVNGVYQGCNKAFEEFLGLPKEKLIGKTVYDVAPKELADKYYRMDKELFDHPGVQVYEYSVKHADGTVREVIFNKATYTDAEGRVAGLIGAMPDITERKRLEQKLARSEGRLRTIIDTEPECVKVVAPDGALIEMNPAGLAMLEADTFDQVAGQNMLQLVAPEYRDAFEALSKKTFRGESGTLEFEIIGLKGTRRWLETRTAPLRDPRGEIFALLGVTRDITERRRMEETHAQTSERLQALIHASPLAVVAFDREGVVTLWNPAAERIFGWSETEALGRFNPIAQEEKKGEFISLLKRVMEGESIEGLELRRQRKDGSVIDVRVSSARLRDADGSISGIMSVIADITERKRAERLIRQNYDAQTAINWVLNISLKDLTLEDTLRQSLDVILSIPWLSFEARGGIFLVEDGQRRLVLKAERGLSDHLKKDCAIVPFGACLCGRAAARGEVLFADRLDDRHEIRYKGIEPHGHYCVPIKKGKDVLGVINLYLKEGRRRDDREVEFLSAVASALAGIIQRKRIEEEREKLIADIRATLGSLSQSHKVWQDTFDGITDEIAIIDIEHRIVKANKAFGARHGLHPRDVVNRRCHDLVHGTENPVMNCPHARTLAEKKAVTEEVLDPRTKRIFLVSTFPYLSPDGELTGVIHVARDVTDEKERETRLIMSERLAALGQMASGIAHEINNPLASIAGCSEGLLLRLKKGQYDETLFAKYLNIIQQEVFRCKSITTTMLSFVRKTTYEKKDVNINEMLDKTLEIIGVQGRLKEVNVVRNYQERIPAVSGNEGELRQVALTIITNALDAMGDQGALTLETRADDGSAVIRIADTGPGIPPDILARVFDPFFTTKSDKGGTGLGLSIARKIITNHNGQISASSDPGCGAAFIITLPC